MIGLEVAPVAPSARLRTTRSGSIESSQSLVPHAIRDLSGDAMVVCLQRGGVQSVRVLGAAIRIVERGCEKHKSPQTGWNAQAMLRKELARRIAVGHRYLVVRRLCLGGLGEIPQIFRF